MCIYFYYNKNFLTTKNKDQYHCLDIRAEEKCAQDNRNVMSLLVLEATAIT